MRISLLLQREPLPHILAQTLSHFWTDQYGHEVHVAWRAGRRRAGPRGSARTQTWLINHYLNAIFVAEAERAIFEPIRREFSRSPIWWRRPAQRSYVAAALAHYSAPWLAQSRLEVTPALPAAHQLLLVAGNHKLRLLDWSQQRTYGILKAGFQTDFIQREIAARQQAAHLGLHVPPLLEVAADGTWFAEALVCGTPLNRLAQPAQATTNALRQLHTLQSATLQMADRAAYVTKLRQQAFDLLMANRLLRDQDRTSLQIAMTTLSSQALTPTNPLHTALTHGDFQPANLLADGEEVWLIDWEYAARRQAGYDLLGYALAARAPQGLAQRLSAFVARGVACAPMLANDPWARAAWADHAARQASAALFLLEELHLHLAENGQPPLTRLGAGLATLDRELQQWIGGAA